MTTTTIGLRWRAVTFMTAGAFAVGGALTLAAGPAQATKDDPHQVWVCKYVKKPGVAETLKGGKNPIFVDYASLTSKKTKPYIGETFQDAHLKSVVVQIGGSNPGVAACLPKTPPTTPPTSTPPTTPPTTSKPPKTTTTTSTSTTSTSTVQPPATTTPAAGGGVPGVGAPDTGGAGDTSPVNTLAGSGMLLAAGGILAAEAVRRRRETQH